MAEAKWFLCLCHSKGNDSCIMSHCWFLSLCHIHCVWRKFLCGRKKFSSYYSWRVKLYLWFPLMLETDKPIPPTFRSASSPSFKPEGLCRSQRRLKLDFFSKIAFVSTSSHYQKSIQNILFYCLIIINTMNGRLRCQRTARGLNIFG